MSFGLADSDQDLLRNLVWYIDTECLLRPHGNVDAADSPNGAL